MADEMLRQQLQRDLERFEKAGMADHAETVKAWMAEMEGEAEESGPTSSSTKAEWFDFRAAQGYAPEDLETLTKAELMELE